MWRGVALHAEKARRARCNMFRASTVGKRDSIADDVASESLYVVIY